MADPRSGHRRARALPVGLALTASLGFLPGVATAGPLETPERATPVAADGPLLSYVVNTPRSRTAVNRVKKAVVRAGGSVVASHQSIGVVVAHAANPGFARTMRAVSGVQSAGATRTAPLSSASSLQVGNPEKVEERRGGAAVRTAEAAGKEPMEELQWDIGAVKADRAARINPGSRDVTVAVIDTGVDDTHPDLAPNFSAAQSANCVGGTADTTDGAWRPYDADEDYHGTHVAGEIAAARNGVGVAGVAPGVKVSSIKVSDAKTSLFYAESVVCAFMFAADHGVEITNSSYYVDPWLFNCKDHPDQRAIAEAVGRATRYAEGRGVLNVASAGNSNADLAADSLDDDSSPNDSTPADREIDPGSCPDVPAQLPGVVTVAATGAKGLKSYYSNFGLGQIDVAAPGGDKYQTPAKPAEDGRILSTMPDGEYAYLQGTSMAGPHVAGVAALVKSRHPQAGPEEIRRLLTSQADNPGCPSAYDPDEDGETDAVCTGSRRLNSFYGAGVVDALDAVTK